MPKVSPKRKPKPRPAQVIVQLSLPGMYGRSDGKNHPFNMTDVRMDKKTADLLTAQGLMERRTHSPFKRVLYVRAIG